MKIKREHNNNNNKDGGENWELVSVWMLSRLVECCEHGEGSILSPIHGLPLIFIVIVITPSEYVVEILLSLYYYYYYNELVNNIQWIIFYC